MVDRIREHGVPFMGPLVGRVVSGAKTVTRRTTKPAAKVGDLIWIREAWRTLGAWDTMPPRMCWLYVSGGEARTPVRYEADGLEVGGPFHHPYDSSPRLGRLRPGMFLPKLLARPWRGRVVDVRQVRLGDLDDKEAIREGCVSYSHDPEACRPPSWSLNGQDFADSPRAAFIMGWTRLHGSWAPDLVLWRMEWTTEVAGG